MPGPGVNIMIIPRSKSVNPARIRKMRRTCSTVGRIISLENHQCSARGFLAERVGFEPNPAVDSA